MFLVEQAKNAVEEAKYKLQAAIQAAKEADALVADLEARLAAAIKAAEGLTGEGLAVYYQHELANAPHRQAAGLEYLVPYSKRLAGSRRKNRDEEHLALALVSWCRSNGPLELPDGGAFEPLAPDRVEESFLGDHLAGVAKEVRENAGRFGRERDLAVTSRQQSVVEGEPKRTEGHHPTPRGGALCGQVGVVHGERVGGVCGAEAILTRRAKTL